MAPLALDRERIRRFLDAAARQLTGEWLLVGGAAAAMWFSDARVTEDINLIGMLGSADERLGLMELATAENLPIEAVNSAADFFVRRIGDWRDHLEVLIRGSSATIYRPDATLFLLLKCGRLSESDLDDCLALVAFAEQHGLALDTARVLAAIEALAATEDAALRERRGRLRVRLSGAS